MPKLVGGGGGTKYNKSIIVFWKYTYLVRLGVKTKFKNKYRPKPSNRGRIGDSFIIPVGPEESQVSKKS